MKTVPFQKLFGQMMILEEMRWDNWTAVPLLIISTESVSEAIKHCEANKFAFNAVFLGNQGASLESLNETFKTKGYGYKERDLQWIENLSSGSLDHLSGQLLRDLIDGKSPEVMGPACQISTELLSLNEDVVKAISDRNVVLSGPPLSGKDAILHQIARKQEKLVVSLNANDLLSGLDLTKFPSATAAIVSYVFGEEDVFGKRLLQSCLNSDSDGKTVIIILRNFDRVLGRENDDSEFFAPGKWYDTCLKFIAALTELQSVQVLISTRPQCHDDLEKCTGNALRLPYITHEDYTKLLKKSCEGNDLPEVFKDPIKFPYFKKTPALCQTMSSLINNNGFADVDHYTINEVVGYYRVKICHSFCTDICTKWLEEGGLTAAVSRQLFDAQYTLIHVYYAFQKRFPSQEIAFLYDLFRTSIYPPPTVSFLDRGLLTFEKPQFNMNSKGYPEVMQNLSFVDDTIVNYLVARGMIYLSLRYSHPGLASRSSWETFLQETVKCIHWEEIYDNLCLLLGLPNVIDKQEIDNFVALVTKLKIDNNVSDNLILSDLKGLIP